MSRPSRSSHLPAFGLALCALAFAPDATSVPRRPPVRGRPAAAPARPATPPAETGPRLITIPVMDAANYIMRMRVWMFTPPADSTAFGLGGLGAGQRVWVLLPSCRPSAEDGRDPCPVGRVSIERVGGTGDVQSTQPQYLAPSIDSRRIQSFVVPEGVQAIRIRVHRRDDAVRYEAAVEGPQLRNLPAPEGQANGADAFTIDLTQYPAN